MMAQGRRDRLVRQAAAPQRVSFPAAPRQPC